jgi:hypothetical protein
MVSSSSCTVRYKEIKMSDTKVLLPHIKLKFNIDHPSFEESYCYGYECSLAEVSEEENPFVPGSSESDQWNDGWWAGFYGEKPLFEKEPMVVEHDSSANDHMFGDSKDNLIVRFFEISGVIVMSAIVGYQLFELVA